MKKYYIYISGTVHPHCRDSSNQQVSNIWSDAGSTSRPCVILSRNTDAKSNFIVAAALGFIKDILIGLRFGANIIIFCVVAFVIRFTKTRYLSTDICMLL